MPSPWDPYDPPPGQAKKHPPVPEFGTGVLVGGLLIVWLAVVLLKRYRGEKLK